MLPLGQSLLEVQQTAENKTDKQRNPFFFWIWKEESDITVCLKSEVDLFQGKPRYFNCRAPTANKSLYTNHHAKGFLYHTPNRRLYKVTDPTFRWIFSLWNENEEIILIDPKIQEILIAYAMLNIYWCDILPVFASFYLFIFAIVIDTDTEYIWFLVRISYLKSCVYSFSLVSG